ncbi:hypothetical protein WJX79_002212 [Trebouxia sp. C0005]
MWKCLSTALGRPDYIRNNPGRLTGRALFRSHLLARQGQLTDIPYKLTSDIITYSRGHWQAGQQDRRYRSHCFTAWGVKQLVHSLRASDLGEKTIWQNDASHRGVSHCVGGLEVAGCKLKLTDAAGVGAVAQQGHASGQPALWLANHMLLYAIFYAMGMLKQRDCGLEPAFCTTHHLGELNTVSIESTGCGIHGAGLQTQNAKDNKVSNRSRLRRKPAHSLLHGRQQASLREQLDPRGRLTTLATRSSANKLRIKAEWLQPPQNASIQQGKAWLKLKGKLDTLGSRPACSTDPHPGAQLICSALTQLSVHFNATPAISGYRTAAVLESTGSGAAIVVAFESKTCLKNKPSRLIGSEGFRQQILKRRGELVLLAPPRAGVGDKSLVVQQEAVHTHQARGSKCSGTAKLSADRSPGLLRRSSCIC